MGATASGKSSVALAVARALGDVEIISADSMQVYRGMDVGTAKPTRPEQAEVPHHLIDVVDPWDDYTVAQFQAAARDAVADIEQRGNRALLVGGTGLYVQAVVDALEIPGQYPGVRDALGDEVDTIALHTRLAELDPVAAGRMEPTNRRRVLRALEVTLGSGRPFSSYGPGLDRFPPTPFTLLGLGVERPELDRRIERRYAQQLESGLLDEVRSLTELPRPLSRTAAQALGYKELLEHIDGDVTFDDALDKAVVRTRQFARRQERWFRRDPRITWIDAGADHNPFVDTMAQLQG